MPHIISDPEYREFAGFKSIGLSPEEIKEKLAYLEDPAPNVLLPFEQPDEGTVVINDWEDK